MNNPISYVKNTRVSYSKFHEKKITEVQVQFMNEDPAWIPMDTLEAMMSALMSIKKEVAN